MRGGCGEGAEREEMRGEKNEVTLIYGRSGGGGGSETSHEWYR